jgi:hypothetical protein
LTVTGYLNNVQVGSPVTATALTLPTKSTLDFSTIGVVDQLKFEQTARTIFDDFKFQWTDPAAPNCIAL